MIAYTKRMKLTPDEFKKVDEVHQVIRQAVDYYASEFRTGRYPNIKVEYITSMKVTTLAPHYIVLFYVENGEEKQNVAQLTVYIEKEENKEEEVPNV